MPDAAPGIVVDHPAAGIVQIRLNRPERRNALATPLLQEIADALALADGDETIRIAVITGGDRLFAAGADLDELAASGSDDPVETPRFLAWQAIRGFSKPLIAAVEGWCLGAGAELMMCADMVVAGSGAGGTAILPRLVGRARAMKMVLTGEPITAEEALACGLIAEVAEEGAALDVALRLAAKLAGRAPLALRAAKASIREAQTLDAASHLVAERRRFIALLGTGDKAEGIAAFREKRAPVWRGQ